MDKIAAILGAMGAGAGLWYYGLEFLLHFFRIPHWH